MAWSSPMELDASVVGGPSIERSLSDDEQQQALFALDRYMVERISQEDLSSELEREYLDVLSRSPEFRDPSLLNMPLQPHAWLNALPSQLRPAQHQFAQQPGPGHSWQPPLTNRDQNMLEADQQSARQTKRLLGSPERDHKRQRA